MTADTYRPSCVVHLRMRFDDALIAEATPTPAPVRLEDAAQRPAVPAPTNTPGGVRTDPRLGAARAALDLTATPELLAPAAADRLSWVMNVIPSRASFDIQGYRLASKFDVNVNFRDLPIDPRACRAVAVEVHVGTVSHDDYARGMRGERDADGRLLSVLRTRDGEGRSRTAREDTLVMIGIVDEWGDTHGSHGSEVHITGRDLRGVLIDSPLNAIVLAQLDSAQTIVELVRQIVEMHPFGGLIRVEHNPAEWPNGVVPAPYAPGLVPRHRQGARGRRRGGRPSVQGEVQRITYWDAITRFCYLVGAIPYFRGDRLTIRPVRSVFDNQRAGFDPSIATPFAGGRTRTVDGRTFGVRRVVYGAGAGKVSMKKRFGGGPRPQVVRVVTSNLSRIARDAPATLEASWPVGTAPAGARTGRVAPGGRAAAQDEMVVPISGITDVSRLRDIARAIFEEVSRNEITGDFDSEAVLASLGGSNQDPDLLRVRPGDTVEFYAGSRNGRATAQPFVSTIGDVTNAPFEAVVREYARRLNGDERLARVIVGTTRGAFSTLQPAFRVVNVHIDWSDSGATVSFDFQNYIVRRFQQSAATDSQQPGQVVTTPTRPQRTPSGGTR